MNEIDIQSHSAAWLLYVKAAFVVSLIAMGAGILFMPGDFMQKGYLALGSLFMVSSSFTIAKTLRDEHESQRLIRKISDREESMSQSGDDGTIKVKA